MKNQELTVQQRALLLALLRDDTDEKIAAGLHVGRRTMQRRLKELMLKANALTRFALGAYAAHNGWLD